MVQIKPLIYKAIPISWPEKGNHLAVETLEFDLNAPPPKNSITTKTYYASFDPYQRGRMRDNSSIVRCRRRSYRLRKIENPYNLDLKIFLGPLGMLGLTAFSSFYGIGQSKKGEAIFVSAASGAVGQIVGQLAKHEGLKVVGSVGNDKKLEFIINELEFDGGFNYKKEKPSKALARLCPDGIDIYYENAGGEQLDAALELVRGMISQYNVKPGEGYPIRNITMVIWKRLTMRGFIYSDPSMAKYAPEHQKKMQKWLHDGTFKAVLSVTEGIDNAPDGFIGMLKGKNFGKAVLKIADMEKDSAFSEEPVVKMLIAH